MNIFQLEIWSPYAVGILIGLLNVLALLFSDNVLGASTSYVKASGMVRRLFDAEYVRKNEYYQKNVPEVDWGVMLVSGIFIGAFISSLLSGDFQAQAVPTMWAAEISGSFFLRLILAFVGGAILGIGSRWSNGCTSGHGISGTSQLSVLSWVATICFFIGGIVVAYLMYGF